MRCPYCRKWRTMRRAKWTTARRACTKCLPFNLYPESWLAKQFSYEGLRQLTLSRLDELRQYDFCQISLPLPHNPKMATWGIDPHMKVAVHTVGPVQGLMIAMLPFMDANGYRSVLFGGRVADADMDRRDGLGLVDGHGYFQMLELIDRYQAR